MSASTVVFVRPASTVPFDADEIPPVPFIPLTGREAVLDLELFTAMTNDFE